MLQRKLLVKRSEGEEVTETEQLVFNSTDMYRWMYDPSVLKVTMIWDRVVGDKVMVFREEKKKTLGL